MTHPTEDELLLLAYGELSEARAVDVESHIVTCHGCQVRLAQLDRGRVALDVALPPGRRRPIAVWAGVALAAAAVLAGLLIREPNPTPATAEAWSPTTNWSATAGYVAGGTAVRDIDVQLTRLEQEWSYGRP